MPVKFAMIICHNCLEMRGTIQTIYQTEADDIDVTAKCLCCKCKATIQDKESALQ